MNFKKNLLTISLTVTASPSKKMLQWSRLHNAEGILMWLSFLFPTVFSPAFRTNIVFLRLFAALEMASSRQLHLFAILTKVFQNITKNSVPTK